MTPEEDSRLDTAAEPGLPTPSTLPNPQPLQAVEAPPSGPPSIADWNMSDFLNFSSPRENPLPSLWTPDSVPQMPNLTDYFQLPADGGGPETGVPGNGNAPLTIVFAGHHPRALQRQPGAIRRRAVSAR